MKKVLLIAIIAIVAVACNKNQSAVKKLDGTWKATSFAVTDSAGVTVDYISFIEVSFQFDGCKLKKDEYCNMSTTTTTNIFGITSSTTQSDLFRVIDDGTTLEIKTDSTTSTMTILELTKSNLKVKQVDGNETTNIVATKTS